MTCHSFFVDISLEKPSENTLNVVSRHGQPYRCAIPSENDVEAQLNRNPETDTPPQPEANAVEQLLSRLTGTCLHKAIIANFIVF